MGFPNGARIPVGHGRIHTPPAKRHRLAEPSDNEPILAALADFARDESLRIVSLLTFQS